MIAVAPDLRERFTGVLLGTAAGDALGLPAENMPPDKIRRRWKGEWKMRLVLGKGMISDDTEHTLMVAQALLVHGDDVEAFQRALAWKLRWWFLGLPGGVGLATARACIKLWLGFPTGRSGVASAGSGPAMRSAIIGAYFAKDAELRKQFVLASARLTHRGWQAETAALAVAESAAMAMKGGQQDPLEILEVLKALSPESEWQKTIAAMESSFASGHSVSDFAGSLKLQRGVTGYALHVVPVAIYAWLRHRGDFRTALTSALDCGGDTDTVGAILGGLAGVDAGRSGIPAEWVGNLWEWPRSVAYMEKVATRLAGRDAGTKSGGAVRYFWPALIPRNVVFLGIVLVHGFRRLLPPY